MLWEDFSNGIIKQNPLFVQVLGVCPALATTTSLTNAVGMGVAFTAVIIGSNLAISLLRSFIPPSVRIPCYIVVIASFVTIIEMLLNAYMPSLYSALGIFIPLIVVNCIILGRAEAFASKRSLFPALLDAIGMGIGFTIALSVVGALRELLGSGQLLGIDILTNTMPPLLIMVLPPGAFITMGALFALVAWRNNSAKGGKA